MSPTPTERRGPVAERTGSYEVRWFFPGTVPEAVAAAMADRKPEARWSPARTDRYLPFAADMGIKLRAEPGRPARLELKGRLRLDGGVTIADGVVGVASTWSKWSYPAEAVPPSLREACEAVGTGVPVEKQRLLRRFALTADGRAKEMPLEAFLERGVQLELTRLRVPGGAGEPAEIRTWTVGLEAFPLFTGVEEATRRAVAGLLSPLSAAGVPLDEAHSASYPEWLLDLG